LCGLLLLQLGRRGGRADRLLFAALAVWALAAALTRPPLQWLGGYELGGLLGGFGGFKPALWLAGAAVLALCLPLLRRAGAVAAPASALGYPGLVLFVGLSEWVLLDLSANGYFDNRFHGLYQQGHVFAAFVLASTVPLLRGVLAHWGLRALGFWPLRMAGRGGRSLAWALAGLSATLAALLAVAGIFAAHRQLSSEIFRLCLLFGLSWFLLARADKLLSPWLRLPPAPGLPGLLLWLRREGLRLRLALPLLALLVFVGLGLLLTEDKGPLLVMLYSGSIVVGLGMAVWLAQRVPSPVALALGMAAVPAYIWAGSFALLHWGGHFGELIAERLESAQNPFSASNDQMAKVLWFQEAAADSGGFGLGQVPWCGELVVATCRGVPPQIQSDYVYTALMGVFGPAGALALLAVLAVWLWRLARYHLAATSGRVDSADVGQAWLSWMALCWAGLTLTQTAVTVAGNLSWLPLTGITFPFLSYGAWSLLGNALFLGLALNLNRPQP
ncbi:MAG: FtsW/RodA/SpoVE family cell cycle protein, partial [Candidatus Methylumidiphilus sp.]